MMDTPDRRLLRDLTGELAPEEAVGLQEELTENPALAARRSRLEGLWRELEPPPPSPVPPFFSARLVARVDGGMTVAWRRGPAWARGAAVGALLAGFVTGVGLGSGEVLPPEELSPDGVALIADVADEPGLAEGYWELLAADWAEADSWEGGS